MIDTIHHDQFLNPEPYTAMPDAAEWEGALMEERIEQVFRQKEARAQLDAPYLQRQARVKAEELGVADKYERLQDSYDYLKSKSICVCGHCDRVGLIAAEIAPLVGVNPGESLIAGVGHDLGKSDIEEKTLHKSVAGITEWDENDRQRTAPHVDKSVERVDAAGIGASSKRIIVVHHGVQKKGAIHRELIAELKNDSERWGAVVLRVADDTDASFRDDIYHDDSAVLSREEKLIEDTVYAIEVVGLRIDEPLEVVARRLVVAALEARAKIMEKTEHARALEVAASAGHLAVG